MLEGITLLSQTELIGADVSGLNIFLFLLCGFAAIILPMFLLIEFNAKGRLVAGIFALFAIGATIFGIKSFSKCNPPVYEYKVLIENSVSMTEFNNQYEIHGQEGQIYTIRERQE